MSNRERHYPRIGLIRSRWSGHRELAPARGLLRTCVARKLSRKSLRPGPAVPGSLRRRPAGLCPAAPPRRRPGLRSPASLISLSSMGGLNSGQAEAQAAAPEVGQVQVTVRRPAAARAAAIAPAPDHPVRGPGRRQRIVQGRLLIIALAVPVPAPLRDVPVHVKEAESVGRLLTHRMSLATRVAFVPAMLAQAPLIIPERIPRLDVRSTGVLPLRLGRQAITDPAQSGTRAVPTSIS